MSNLVVPDRRIVDNQGNSTQEMQLFLDDVSNFVIVGSGTPEGNVDALQGRLYMDDTGSSGSILYVKKLSDIGGDASQGWVLV